MTPRLLAGYWPNGPTFAAPKDWSNAILSEGVEFGKTSTLGSTVLKKEREQRSKNSRFRRYEGISIVLTWRSDSRSESLTRRILTSNRDATDDQTRPPEEFLHLNFGQVSDLNAI